MITNRFEYYETRDEVIFNMHREQRKKYKEIAPEFGLTESGVKQAIRRHRGKLISNHNKT